jgi:hypothetical protein
MAKARKISCGGIVHGKNERILKKARVDVFASPLLFGFPSILEVAGIFHSGAHAHLGQQEPRQHKPQQHKH